MWCCSQGGDATAGGTWRRFTDLVPRPWQGPLVLCKVQSKQEVAVTRCPAPGREGSGAYLGPSPSWPLQELARRPGCRGPAHGLRGARSAAAASARKTCGSRARATSPGCCKTSSSGTSPLALAPLCSQCR